MKRKMAIVLILSGALIFAAGLTIMIMTYRQDEINIDMSEHVIRNIRAQVITQKEGAGEAPSTYISASSPEEIDPLKREIDFEELYRINSDVAFWLYIPGTFIDYPVMSDETGYYLDHDITGRTGSWGSLFTYPAYLGSDMPVIFGHHVTGYEPAFGQLQNFLDETFAMEHSKAYVYLPDGTVKTYSFYCSLATDTSDIIYETYYYRKNTERWGALLNHLSADCAVSGGIVRAGVPDRLLALSTCREYNTQLRITVIFCTDV